MEDGRLEHRGRWRTTEVPEDTGSYGVHWGGSGAVPNRNESERG